MSVGKEKKGYFFRKKKEKIRHSLYLGHDAIFLHSMLADNNIEKQQYSLAERSLENILNTIANQYSPKDSEINLILGASWYQILHCDKPKVENNELKDAIAWAVKDMVSVQVENLVMDYFEVPISALAKINIVVTDKQALYALVSNLFNKGFKVSSISIEEMAIANADVENSNAKLVISKYPKQDVSLQIIKNGCIYLERRIKGFADLDEIDFNQLPNDYLEKLNDEIVRSLNFYQSQLRQESVQFIEVLISPINRESLKQFISAYFSIPVKTLCCQSVGEVFAASGWQNHQVEGIKARVTLLDHSFIPKKTQLNLKQCLIAASITGVIAMSSLTISHYVNDKQTNELRLNQQLLTKLTKQKNKQEQKIKQRQASPALIQNIALAENRIETMKLLSNKINGFQGANLHGFSSILKDLAKVNNRSLWLTKIVISDEQILFQGAANKGSDIPKWINSLKTSQSLAGKKFKTIEIAQNEQAPVHFLLTSGTNKSGVL